MRAKVLRAISMLSTYGNALRELYSRPLRTVSSNYGFLRGLTLQGCSISLRKDIWSFLPMVSSKKTQKTLSGEIETALKYKADWLERRKSNG